jgi:hypothetical protein
MPAPLVAVGLAAARVAAKKIIKNKAKTTVAKRKPASAETIKTQKASVKKITPAKPKPNPPSKTKMREYEVSSVSRSFNPMTGEMAEGSVGKLRDVRIAKSKIFKSQNPIGTKKDIKVMENRSSKRPVVKVNSANLKANRIIKKSK